MRFRAFGMLSLALAMCLATSLMAQDEAQRQRGGRQRGGPGGPGGPGGGAPGMFGGRGGPGMGGGAALELMGLLQDDKVRKEVDLDDDTYKAANAAVSEARDKMREESGPMFQQMRDASEAERAEMMKKMQEQMQKVNQVAQDTLDEVLPPSSQQRLMGLLVQLRGMSAVTNDLIAKQIGLGADGVEKVRKAMEDSQAGMREKMREAFQSGDRDGMREKMQEMMEQSRKDGDAAIAKVLTDDQRKKLDDLKGEEFEFGDRQALMGGRGGPGGGFGGRGGPGGGPGGPGGRRGGGNDN